MKKKAAELMRDSHESNYRDAFFLTAFRFFREEMGAFREELNVMEGDLSIFRGEVDRICKKMEIIYEVSDDVGTAAIVLQCCRRRRLHEPFASDVLVVFSAIPNPSHTQPDTL